MNTFLNKFSNQFYKLNSTNLNDALLYLKYENQNKKVDSFGLDMNETYIKTYSDAENHSHPTNSDNLRINNINVKVQKKNQTFSNLNTNMKSINPRLNFDILLKKAKKLEKRKIKKFFIMNKDFLTKIDFVTIKKIKVIRFDKNNENCSSLSKQISKKAIENNFNFKRKRVAIFDKRKNSLIICLYKNQNDINILDN